MKKVKSKKSAAKKSTAKVSGAARAKTKITAAKGSNGAAAAADLGAKLSFNHAMIYSPDVGRAIGFYRDLMGFKLIEDFRHENKSVYARMRAPGGDGTIAIHQSAPGSSVASDGVRLYFEIRELDEFCRTLQRKNFYITQTPRMMPWGWRHAYLNDPDGHEISLYWAGENRMKKTVMQAAAKAARA
jgi:catechol 2,3-dioxygenase-like lactoylglutathione lyase family enzyme